MGEAVKSKFCRKCGKDTLHKVVHSTWCIATICLRCTELPITKPEGGDSHLPVQG